MTIKTYFIKTLGCKANFSDSQFLEQTLKKFKLQQGNEEAADLLVINSCTVTDEAHRQSAGLAKKAKKVNPNVTVLMTGCGAEVDPEGLSKNSHIDWILGNQNKFEMGQYLEELLHKNPRSKLAIETPVDLENQLNRSEKNSISLQSSSNLGSDNTRHSNVYKILGTVKNYDSLRSTHPMDRDWAYSSAFQEVRSEPEFDSNFVTNFDPKTDLDADADSDVDTDFETDSSKAQTQVQVPIQSQALNASTDGSQSNFHSNIQSQTERTRGFLKVQEGCNAFCTYCIIPYSRGPSRSFDMQASLKVVDNWVKKGTQEIVLTGTNLGHYGISTDHKSSTLQLKKEHSNYALEDLVKNILTQTSLPRLRLSSLNPKEITPGLLDLMEEFENFCPHWHISLQAIHPRILRAMKRGYEVQNAIDCLEAIEQLNTPLKKKLPFSGFTFVGMDLITGFPSETEEEFEAQYNLLEKLPFTRLHIFPYSDRWGTPSSKIPGKLDSKIKKSRVDRLKQLSLQKMKFAYQQVLDHAAEGLLEPLIESKGQKWRSGYTPNYVKLLFPHDLELTKNQTIFAKPIAIVEDTHQQEVALIAQPKESF